MYVNIQKLCMWLPEQVTILLEMFSSQERVIHCLHEVSEQTIDTPTKHQKLDEIDAYKNPVVAESQCKIGILRLVTPMHH